MAAASTGGPARNRWWRGSFAARLVLLSVGLLAVVQLASVLALGAGLGQHARHAMPQRLLQGERVLDSLLAQRAQALLDATRLLASDQGFREAVLSDPGDGHEETIASALENFGERIQATEVVYLQDRPLQVKAAAGALRGRSDELVGVAATLRAMPGAMAGVSGYAMFRGQPHQVAMVPVKAPHHAGWALMGFPLDASLTQRLREMSGFELTVLARSARGAPWQPALSGLGAPRAAALAAQAWPEPSAAELQTVAVDGEELGLRGRLLPLAQGGTPEASVLALVSVSMDEATRTPRSLLAGLAAVTLGAVVVFALGSLVVARHATIPLRRVAEAADRLGAGDHETPIKGLGREDEFGQLAKRFEQMRLDIGTQQRRIERAAYEDELTGLPNRERFRREVREAVAAAPPPAGRLAVLMLNLDRFKHVNDVLGHDFGDRVLVAVGERLRREVLREGDVVARLGGDQFAVLLPGADVALAQAVAERLRRRFAEPLTLGGQTIDIGAGIGIACWPIHAPDAELLLSRAETAMHAAKKRGAEAHLYDSAIDAASAQTLSLLSDLRQAIAQDQLRLVLQPKLALSTGSVIGAEALVRWQHPIRGMVPPMQFIPFAEQTGFIRELTLWVFREAARQWRQLHEDGITLKLSLNLSARDLLDRELPEKFAAELERQGVPSSALCLEITESAVMDDMQRALATLDRLAAMGFRLSIDDFGTGESSLAYLLRLPVQELKMDRTFVAAMEQDRDAELIVRSTVNLAHELGLSVVAEGVETARVWTMLRELGCDEAQGYHMGKPMPPSDFKAWSTGWSERLRPAAAGVAARLH